MVRQKDDDQNDVVPSDVVWSNQTNKNHVVLYLQCMLVSRIKISVITDISILGFYRYIGNIGKISMDILTKISIKRKLTKIF